MLPVSLFLYVNNAKDLTRVFSFKSILKSLLIIKTRQVWVFNTFFIHTQIKAYPVNSENNEYS